MLTFVQACLVGAAHSSEVDDWIDNWHMSPSTGVSLSEYLGFDLTDYALWLVKDLTVEEIVETYRKKQPQTEDIYYDI
jgi:hypothetical protein